MKLKHCLKCRRGWQGYYHSCIEADRRDRMLALKQKINQEAFMVRAQMEMGGHTCKKCRTPILRRYSYCELCLKDKKLDYDRIRKAKKKAKEVSAQEWWRQSKEAHDII